MSKHKMLTRLIMSRSLHGNYTHKEMRKYNFNEKTY